MRTPAKFVSVILGIAGVDYLVADFESTWLPLLMILTGVLLAFFLIRDFMRSLGKPVAVQNSPQSFIGYNPTYEPIESISTIKRGRGRPKGSRKISGK